MSHLCYLHQVGADGEPISSQHLELQSDDGQSQRGALELPKLVAGHTVLHLSGPQRHLEAWGPVLMLHYGTTHFRVHTGAQADGRDEEGVARDEQGVELQRDGQGNLTRTETKSLASSAHLFLLSFHNI